MRGAARARFICLRPFAKWRTGSAVAFLIRVGREGGFAATWTAPPPMIAPPHVHAHSFAKAIFTDISRTLFLVRCRPDNRCQSTGVGIGVVRQMQRIPFSASALTTMKPRNASQRALSETSVPLGHRVRGAVNDMPQHGRGRTWLTICFARRFESESRSRPEFFGPDAPRARRAVRRIPIIGPF
jgi:hypothetical protein